jgi:hypothetical protein
MISPEELMTRLGVLTRLYAASEETVFGALNDKDSGLFFAIARAGGNFLWRAESPVGWALSPPLLWGGLCIAGTSTAGMSRSEDGGEFATVDWRRGGAVIAFGAGDGEVCFIDERCGIVRETPRAEGDTLIVRGEIRIGGFRDEQPWSSSAEIESRFALPSGELISRRARGDLRPEDFSGEPPPEAWE